MNKTNPTPFQVSGKSWQSDKKISNVVYNPKVRIVIFMLAIIGLIGSLYILIWCLHKNEIYKNQVSTLSMIDVGQGDGFIIDVYTGHRIAVDLGLDSEKFLKGLDEIEKHQISDKYGFLRIGNVRKTIDLLFLTHDDADHAGALPDLVNKLNIGAIIISPLNYSYINKVEKSEQKDMHIIRVVNGYNLSIGASFKTQIIGPSLSTIISAVGIDKFRNVRAQNEHSIMMQSVVNNHSIMFTGDAGKNEEQDIVSAQLDFNSEFLKVGHHGSKNSSSNEFLNAVSPQFALISVGIKNKYKHPHPTVLEGLNNLQSLQTIFRTDQCGTLSFVLWSNRAVGIPKCIKKHTKV